MTIRLVTPVKAVLEGYDEHGIKALGTLLTYHDKRVDHEIQRIKNSPWEIERLKQELGGDDEFLAHMAELKKQRTKSLLFQDKDGTFWTYSGLAQRVANHMGDKIVREYHLPEPKLLPWDKTPTKVARPYQQQAHDELMKVGHGGVEIGTGLGKSFIIQLLVKSIGRRAVIMAPSSSIARQLFEEMERHFGKKRVGLYGDGKKDFKKLITVATGQSLTRIEELSPAWNELSKAEVFIADESHQTPAATLQNVCFGLVANAPYRFFFSGTQMRNDGLDPVLEGITSSIVFRMTVREGVDQGYLAKPLFTMFKLQSKDKYWSKDPNKLTRAHGFKNPAVIKLAADIANKSVEITKRPVLILIDEMDQFARLLPLLKYECRFAHGGVTKDNADKVPALYQDSDPNKFVEEFNDGKIKILIGTSCVATGTDIRAAKHIIYLRFGASPIEVRQAVGRGTRRVEGKEDCYFTDFWVENIETLDRHAKSRRALYEDIYGPVRVVTL
jgi:superfamily II DNA or RNA helicase